MNVDLIGKTYSSFAKLKKPFGLLGKVKALYTKCPEDNQALWIVKFLYRTI